MVAWYCSLGQYVVVGAHGGGSLFISWWPGSEREKEREREREREREKE
jgi:photosystem II stability/assembly factor-like uncharacterized protein